MTSSKINFWKSGHVRDDCLLSRSFPGNSSYKSIPAFLARTNKPFILAADNFGDFEVFISARALRTAITTHSTIVPCVLLFWSCDLWYHMKKLYSGMLWNTIELVKCVTLKSGILKLSELLLFMKDSQTNTGWLPYCGPDALCGLALSIPHINRNAPSENLQKSVHSSPLTLGP